MPEPLAANFSSITTDEWLDAALKGKPDGDAATVTDDGIRVNWLYTPADALAPDPGGVPGRAPFVRGTGSGTAEVPWEIRQEQRHPERAAARDAILEDLEGGATQIELRLDRAAREGHAPGTDAFARTRGRDGVMISTVDDLDATLDGVHLDLAPVALTAGPQAAPASALLLALLRRRGFADADARGSLRLDPLGVVAESGAIAGDLDDAVAAAGRLAAELATSHPQLRSLAVDTRAYVNAGATAVRELAIAIATGAAYLRAADDAGLAPADAASRIEFTLAVGPDQFQEIAKLRAFRRLWARVLELSGVPEAERHSPLFARTSDRMLAAIDPWSNMLRATTAGFAAAVGGADGLTVTPFDALVVDAVDGAASGGLGRRIARNTQLILQEESGLRRVADPAGGSWYVESLSDALARAAWEQIQAIEADGGAVAALQGGRWAAELAEQADRRADQLARRRREMTGVNVFPLLGDDKIHPDPLDREGLAAVDADRLAERPSVTLPDSGTDLATLIAAAEAGARIDELAALVGTGPIAADPDAALPVLRDAAPFEALRRDAGSGPAAITGDELPASAPRVTLACLGPLAGHASAATWAQNFFGVGGLSAVQSTPIEDPAAAGNAVTADGTTVAAVCFGRDVEEGALSAAVASLRDAGARTVYLIKGSDEQVAASGADAALKDGVDMIQVLGDALRAAGTGQEVAR
jgi:methylmalonyl-CoA mutase